MNALPRTATGSSLRLQLHAIVLAMMLLFIGALLWLRIDATRASVREEITGSNRVAAQLLERVSWIFARGGPPAMLEFLDRLGRVRANEITLVDTDGRELYRSPASTYKEGRSAPEWFTELVTPALQRQQIRMPGATLTIESNPSRAILDGWDDLWQLAGATALALAVVLAAVVWAVHRALKPFGQIVAGLQRLQQGDYAARLPALPGREAALIGDAVNRLGEAIETTVQQRIAAHAAEQRLADSRDWARRVEQRLEAERREIAAELHDELGQSVTGIRSLARSLATRLPADDAVGRDAAQLIDTEAARLYDAMHGLIPRLTPLTLGPLGLPDALQDLLASLRARHVGTEFALQIDGADGPVDPEPALAAYRTVQEAVNNALKHSGGQRIAVALRREGERMHLTITDNGRGLPASEGSSGRFGLRSLRGRVEALGGRFEAGQADGGGACVQVELPARAPEAST
ncbi:methanol utilization protein MoxY [Ideonella sp. 4Y11]|uniref:histidine kinase n=1 Tax=Ideonella aquatica TaxID=2824119 RepID=A0A940YSQ8_9BURK|nr:ATP-binding protein [Ideonella aquatica]MBQ0961193.1 methanol utilization protein MoxY [Ideonella aquatica]